MKFGAVRAWIEKTHRFVRSKDASVISFFIALLITHQWVGPNSESEAAPAQILSTKQKSKILNSKKRITSTPTPTPTPTPVLTNTPTPTVTPTPTPTPTPGCAAYNGTTEPFGPYPPNYKGFCDGMPAENQCFPTFDAGDPGCVSNPDTKCIYLMRQANPPFMQMGGGDCDALIISPVASGGTCFCHAMPTACTFRCDGATTCGVEEGTFQFSNCTGTGPTSTPTPTPTLTLTPTPTPTTGSCPNWSAGAWINAWQTLSLTGDCGGISCGGPVWPNPTYRDPWHSCTSDCGVSDTCSVISGSEPLGNCNCPLRGSVAWNAMTSANQDICCYAGSTPTPTPTPTTPSSCPNWTGSAWSDPTVTVPGVYCPAGTDGAAAITYLLTDPSPVCDGATGATGCLVDTDPNFCTSYACPAYGSASWTSLPGSYQAACCNPSPTATPTPTPTSAPTCPTTTDCSCFPHNGCTIATPAGPNLCEYQSSSLPLCAVDPNPAKFSDCTGCQLTCCPRTGSTTYNCTADCGGAQEYNSDCGNVTPLMCY